MATPRSSRKRTAKSAGDDKAAKGGVASAEQESSAAIEDAIVLTDPISEEPIADARPEEVQEIEAEEKSVKLSVEADDTVSKETAEPVVAQPPAMKAKSGSGFVGTLFGGILAAAIGFGLARYVVPEGWPIPGNTPLQDQLTAQSETIDSLNERLEVLSQAPEFGPDEALVGQIDELRGTVNSAMQAAEAAKAAAEMPVTDEALIARVTAIEDRVTSLEDLPVSSTTTDPAALNRLKADIQALRADLESQKAATEKAAAEATSAAEAARAEATAEAQDVLLRASLAKVEAAMQSGAPYADALEQLSAAGLDIPAALSQSANDGLVTLATLSESFVKPARAALEETLRGDMGDTMTQRISSFLRSQTGARSLTPREGDDPDAVLSRAEAALNEGELATALTEISTLPESAQAALAEWAAQAQHRENALEAAASISVALSER